MSEIEPSKLSLLRDLPRKNLTPEQQLEAIRKVQAQAEQRVKLGMQLFKAAEARMASQQDMVDKFRAEQNALRDQVQQDVAKTLQDYDQWVGRIDESFTHAIQRLEERLDGLDKSVAESDQRVEKMLERAEGMLEQTRYLLKKAKRTPAEASPTAAAPSVFTQQAPPPPASSPESSEASPTVHAEPSATLPPVQGDADSPSMEAAPSETEQEKVYSRLLDQLRR
ncbi:MAG: hypothetical protein ACOC3G_07045, partial [Phycisphaeraceae bacterium]